MTGDTLALKGGVWLASSGLKKNSVHVSKAVVQPMVDKPLVHSVLLCVCHAVKEVWVHIFPVKSTPAVFAIHAPSLPARVLPDALLQVILSLWHSVHLQAMKGLVRFQQGWDTGK